MIGVNMCEYFWGITSKSIKVGDANFDTPVPELYVFDYRCFKNQLE